MKSNSLKIHLLISSLFLIFSCLLFFYFYREINNNNTESQLKETQLQIETLRRQEIRDLNNSIKIIEEEKAQLETHFAQSSDIVMFLDTIEGLAREADAKAEVVSAVILKDNTGLLVGMSGSGDFDGLYKFLTLLENSPYELEFMGMNMRRATALDVTSKNVIIPKWNVNFSIKLLSFVL
ncbi:hypothetical protein EXS45_01680 [Candidatus Nomurabacteria bacterium]|nr:hypothetical protein [Candidatus Nomurabacteria bacterium]